MYAFMQTVPVTSSGGDRVSSVGEYSTAGSVLSSHARHPITWRQSQLCPGCVLGRPTDLRWFNIAMTGGHGLPDLSRIKRCYRRSKNNIITHTHAAWLT